MKRVLIFIMTTLAGITFLSCNAMKQEQDKENMETDMNTDTAIFATGCFWCTEAIFSEHSIQPHLAALFGPRSIGLVVLESPDQKQK